MQVAQHVSLRAVCLDRATGRTVWEATLFDVPNPDPVHWLNSWATPTPVVEPGRVYCDFGTFGTVCLEAATGQVLWKQQLRLDHQVGPGSSPVLWQDRLVLVRDGRDAQYWVSDDGMATCADARSGKIFWQERLGGSFMASPLSARGRLYFFRRDATTFVLKAGPRFERVAENPLEGTLIATPALGARALYLRTDGALYCIEQ